MNYSANAPTADHVAISAWVWYEGTDALREGEALCYNTDFGTATERNRRRNNHVERPSAANNYAFAGVAARDYSASPTGRFIEIYVPGSRGVNIALGVDTVLDGGILTFVAGAGGSHRGRFHTGKFTGRGSAVPRQTVTALKASSFTGGWSLGTDGISLTITSTEGLAVGDTVVLLGGEDEGSDKKVIPGKYTIQSIDSATALSLDCPAAGATPSAALTCTGYVYSGNPKCQADLLEGEESGGVEFISLPNAGGDDQPYMPGGVSYVCGGITLTADAECELAQGTVFGEKKAFICLGTLTTKAFVVDLVTNGLNLAGAALAEVNAIDAADDACFLQFNGAKWRLVDLAGGATAVSPT